jgi:APA family basic amino acid/polyamine antiporter
MSDGPEGTSGGLLKILGVGFGIAVLVGNTIGMGILRTPGEVAARVPNVTLFILVWVAGATYALLGALTLAELGAMIPRSGGQYPLVRRALGPFWGFVTGWNDWIATCGSMAAVAIVIGEYIGPLVPPLLGHQSLTASAVVVAFALLLWRGIKIGDIAQQVTSLLKGVALIGLAIVILVMSGDGATATPGAAAAAALPSGLALAAAIIVALQSAIYTYDGWTGPIYFGEETTDPGRNIPRSMIGGVLVVLVIYLMLNLAFLRVVPIGEMAGDPFVAATAASRLFGPAGDTVLRVMMIVSLVAAVNALQLIGSRVPYAMSRDGLMPKALRRVNPGGTPVTAMVAGTVIALVFIATNTFDTVLALLAFLFVVNYALSFTSLFVLRRREPDTPRPFRTPGYPWVPGVALAGSLAFMIAALLTDRTNSLIAVGLLAASWPIYRFVIKTTDHSAAG